MKLTKLNL